MGIFNNKIELDENNPFKEDKLNRIEEAKILTSLFEAVENQMVLAIDSPWGTGKTTFLKMWNKYLKGYGYQTVYFNCWKNDFVEDPFIAFIEEFREQLDSSLVSKDFREKASDVGKCLIKNIPGVLIKGIKDKTGIDVNEIISEDDLESLVQAKMDDYSKTKDSVEKFKKELKNLSDKNMNDTKKPLVVFVDELDRCRPDFAISLLERIKHFLNVENIIFVLGIDKDALSNSIKIIYGNGTDIEGYLTRFIDLEYRLSQKYNDEYVRKIIEKYNFKEIFNKSHPKYYEYFVKNCSEVIKVFCFSLRDIEKFISKVYLIMKTNTTIHEVYELVIFLAALNKFNKKLYYKLKNKEINASELISSISTNLEIESWFNDMESQGVYTEAYLIYIMKDVDRIKDKESRISEESNYTIYNNIDTRCIEFYNNLRKRIFISDLHSYIFDRIDLYKNY